METRLVAFFDLLGFSSIIQSRDLESVNKQEKILALLSEFSESSGDFTYTTKPVDEKTTDHTIKPAISAFSDNIVYSFPLDGIKELGSGPIFFYLVGQASSIFLLALELGCLIRGGITIGQLYHKKHVVFGPALVEAYELESKHAKSPRILISDSAMEFVDRHPFVGIDEDGCSFLDYLNAAYQDALKAGREKGDDKFAQGWWHHFERIIANEVERLKASNNFSGRQNWQWTHSRWNKILRGRQAAEHAVD